MILGPIKDKLPSLSNHITAVIKKLTEHHQKQKMKYCLKSKLHTTKVGDKFLAHQSMKHKNKFSTYWEQNPQATISLLPPRDLIAP